MGRPPLPSLSPVHRSDGPRPHPLGSIWAMVLAAIAGSGVVWGLAVGLGLSDLAETQKPGDPDPVAEIPSSPPPPALDPVVLTLEPDQDNVVATNSLEAELRQDPGKQALSKAGDGESEVSVDRPWDPWQGGSFPLENFVAYTSPFGYRQHPFGGWRFHYGLDLAAPMGSYIRSWWEGKIVEVSDDTACGTSIVIESGDWIHIYCHMQGYVVIEPDGDRWLVDNAGGVQLRQETTVYTGQRIGRVGMTGRTTGPHLHWGLKYQNRWVDPAMVVRAMLASQGE